MTESVPDKLNVDPDFLKSVKAAKDILSEAEKKGVRLKDLGEPNKAVTLVIKTGSGVINLSRKPFKIDFNVNSSEDPSMQAGETIALDGASMSGKEERPGFFGPNARLTFRKKLPVRFVEFGNDDTDNTITKETYNRIETTYGQGKIYEQLEDGRLASHIVNPTMQTTDFVAHAQLMDESGVTDLF